MSTDFIQQFHFLEPWWLLGLIPAALFLWLLWQQRRTSGSVWNRVVDNSLLPYLLVKDGERSKIRLPLMLLGVAWMISMLALANPTWQRLPQPVYQQPEAQVIVLDLSPTMLAQDVSPSRLVQARFKVEDILRRSKGKQTGLVVYSGDAFTVTPLTDDIATIKSQLRVLEPSLMPAIGNRPDLGLKQAGELLKQAGFSQGHIILLADEAGQNFGQDFGQNSGNIPGKNETVNISKQLAKKGYQVSVLGIGTHIGAPIPGVRDASNKPIMSRVDNQALQQIANAGDGKFAAFTSNQQDVQSILAASHGAASDRVVKDNAKKKQAERWEQMGPYLAVLLLPLLAFAFRRGWLLSLGLVVLVQFSMPQPAMASGWDNLWQRPDQQAATALQQGKFSEAARMAQNPAQRGAAEYRDGNYQQAIESFTQQNNPTGAYNLGNALAKAGEYEKSLAAYDKALKQQPGMENAAFNRKLVEDLLKKQQEQQKQQEQNQEQNKQQSAQDKQDQNNNQDKQDDNKQSQNQQQSAQQKQDQNQAQQQNQQDNQQQNDQQNGKEQQKNQQANSGDASKSTQSEAEKQSNNPQEMTPENSNQQAKQDDQQQSQQQAEQQTRQKEAQSEAQKPQQNQQQDQSFDQAGSKDDQQQAKQSFSEAAKAAQDSRKPDENSANKPQAIASSEDKLTPEQRQSVENWLRRVPDDPGGLLRRKFLYQYQQRQQQNNR